MHSIEYRTRIGTRFYDRENEINDLLELIERSSYTILWGPKNVGKSELLRYISHVLENKGWFIYYIDVREYLSRKQLSIYSGTIDHRSFLESILDVIGLPNRMLELFERGYRYALEERAKGILWVFDEPHYLSNAKAFLEALIKRVIYTLHEKPLSIALSVSDGWFIDSDVVASLLEYGAYHLFIDELDLDSFSKLYCELRDIIGVKIDLESRVLYDRYTGGNPGYLIELLRSGSVGEWIASVERMFLSRLESIVRDTEFNWRDIVEYIAGLPREIDLLGIDKSEYLLINCLLRRNLVYYDMFSTKTTVKPLIPVYREIALKILSRR